MDRTQHVSQMPDPFCLPGRNPSDHRDSRNRNRFQYSDAPLETSWQNCSEMVGQRIAQFAFIEVKTETGRPTKEQLELHRQFLHDGAIGGIARSPEEAIILLKGRCVT